MSQRTPVAGPALVLVFSLACHQAPPPAAPLREDPALAQQLRQERKKREEDFERRVTSAEEAARMEASLRLNPEDLDARARLLHFYEWTPNDTRSWNDLVLARRRHLTWLVAHHPENDLAINSGARASKMIDPVGHEELERLWRAHVRDRDASISVLDNAAIFFQQAGDTETTEQLLLLIQARPQDRSLTKTVHDCAITPIWLRLGGLYAEALSAENPSRAASAFAAHVRTTLDASHDASLLAAVAQALQNPVSAAVGPPDPNAETPSSAYLEKALAIDPSNAHANYVRANIARDFGRPVAAAAMTRRTEPDGSSLLACRADAAYYRRQYQQARALAEEALRVAPTVPRDRSTCDAPLVANLVLALTEFHDGHRDPAVAYLRDASRAGKSSMLADGRPYPVPLEWRLLNSLLKNGERTSVAEYLEQAATSRTPADAARMRKEASAIRAGIMPETYQRARFAGEV